MRYKHGFRHLISENEFHALPKPIQPWRRIITYIVYDTLHYAFSVPRRICFCGFSLCLWGRRRHWGIPRFTCTNHFGLIVVLVSWIMNSEMEHAVTLTQVHSIIWPLKLKSWYCLANPTFSLSLFVSIIIFIVISKTAPFSHTRKAEKNVIKKSFWQSTNRLIRA